MVHVEEVNDFGQLAHYRLLWHTLLSETRGATFHHGLDWLEVYWKHFGQEQRLRVLVVYSNNRAIGILPLVVRRESTRVGAVRVLTYPLHDWGTFYGPIGPNPTATLTAGLRHIRQTERDWDLLDLRWVDRDGFDRGRTERAMQWAGFPPRRQAWDRAPMIDMRGTWADYWQGRSKSWRTKVRRSQRKLAQGGEATHVRYRPRGAAQGDGNPRWDLYDACLEVARRSWQGSSANGTTLCHLGVRDYLRDTHAAAARAGSLDLNLLVLGGEPIAFAYNYHFHGHVYAVRSGYDPRMSDVGPGTVLDRLQLEDGFRRGDGCYDLGAGSLDVKRHWQTSIATSYRYTHFPNSVGRVQFLRMKRWLQEKLYSQGYVACRQTA